MSVKQVPYNIIENHAPQQQVSFTLTLDGYKQLGGVGVNPYDWQPEAWNQLTPTRRRRLLAPTGCGKSVFIRALSWSDLSSGYKVLIVVPQLSIARSAFRPEKFILPNGKKVTWTATHLYDRDESTIAFLAGPEGPGGPGWGSTSPDELGTPQNRIVVCTHQTAVLAHQRMQRHNRPWNKVSLVIDEAHFVLNEVGTTDDGEVKVQNELGKMVDHWLEEDPGPLFLVTATWVRGDLNSVVPRDRLPEFESGFYQRTADKHFASMQYLRRIEFGYIMGTPAEVIRFLYKEEHKGIFFARSVQSMTGEDNVQTRKQAYLAECMAACGPVVSENGLGTEHQFSEKRTITVCDLITDTDLRGRAKRVEDYVDSCGNHSDTPDLTFALNIGKLGLDSKTCNLVVVDRPRRSGDFMQRGGRAFRDHPGKPVARVYTVLDPLPNKEAPDYLTKLKNHMRVTMGSLVIDWQFKVPDLSGLTSKQKDAIEAVRSNVDLTEEVLSDVINTAFKPNVGKTDEEALKEVIRLAFPSFDDEEIEGVTKVLDKEMSKRAHILRDLHTAEEIPFDPTFVTTSFGAIRSFVMCVDPEALGRLREKLETTPKYADLRTEVIRLGWKTPEMYEAGYQTIPGAPQYPAVTYGREWRENGSWKYFLGKCKKVVRYPKFKRAPL